MEMEEGVIRSSRPPIVAILGHVDHGKTTLLDRIRKTNVAGREVGGITQHIGAYQVKTPQEKLITFIDTPGHEAFSKMRSRGARVADIVLLVVAADSGVKPQTRESLSHIKEAGVPFMVVITKIDLPSAQVEQVKAELEKEGVALEGRGGDVVVVPVSAKTGEGLDHLLEMISLVSEIHGVSSSKDAPLEAVVIESGFDSKRGPFPTVLVRAGKISVGDRIWADGVAGRVRALLDENGKNMKVVLPSQPTQILGFEETPPVGSKIILGGKPFEKPEVLPVLAKTEAGGQEKLQLIVKADTAGRVEALIAALPPEIEILGSGVGEVTSSDVMLASSFGALILAFGVKTPPSLLKLAQEEKVTIAPFSVIYEAIDWVNKMLEEQEIEEEKVQGRAQIIAEFPFGVDRKIAGVKVLDGKITKADKLMFLREGKPLGQARIESMKQKDKAVDRVEKGGECGILFAGKIDFQAGDVIESTHDGQK